MLNIWAGVESVSCENMNYCSAVLERIDGSSDLPTMWQIINLTCTGNVISDNMWNFSTILKIFV